MGHEAIKLELIEWIAKLEDEETIDYLKIVKDTNEQEDDWWHTLTDQQKSEIERGLKDIEEGRITSHDIVKKEYGL